MLPVLTRHYRSCLLPLVDKVGRIEPAASDRAVADEDHVPGRTILIAQLEMKMAKILTVRVADLADLLAFFHLAAGFTNLLKMSVQ